MSRAYSAWGSAWLLTWACGKGGNAEGAEEMRAEDAEGNRQRQTQIPCGNDKQKHAVQTWTDSKLERTRSSPKLSISNGAQDHVFCFQVELTDFVAVMVKSRGPGLDSFAAVMRLGGRSGEEADGGDAGGSGFKAGVGVAVGDAAEGEDGDAAGGADGGFQSGEADAGLDELGLLRRGWDALFEDGAEEDKVGGEGVGAVDVGEGVAGEGGEDREQGAGSRE